MKVLTRGWAALALTGLAGGAAQAQIYPAAVDSPPSYAAVQPASPVPAGEQSEWVQAGLAPQDAAPPRVGPGAMAEGPQNSAPAGTLNAQYAAMIGRPGGQAGSATADPAPPTPARNPSPPSVAIARRVIDAAGAFEAYMRTATAISASFNDAEMVSRALALGSSYQPQQLQEGAVAYAALAALQDPMFVQSVNDMARDPAARADLARQLAAHPEVILQAQGARIAATTAAGVLGRLGEQLRASGQAVKQYAYAVQRQPWSKAAPADPDAQLARIKAQSMVAVSLTPSDTEQLISSIVALRRAGAGPQLQATSATPAVVRGLALAALAVIGAAGEDRSDQIAPILADAQSAQCVKMAKMNLYQCLSAAGPHYEDVFCLGQHAMMETAQCVVQASGAGAVDAPPRPDPHAILVPIALASAGPIR